MLRVKRNFLPYGRQAIDEDDISAVVEVLRGAMLTTGPAVERFERKLKDVTKAPHALACSSGTAALHLAMRAMGIGKGSRVIVPSITFVATANVAALEGADVIFADVDPTTGLMTPDTLSAAIKRAGGKADLVVPVHYAGQCEDLGEIQRIAHKAGSKVLEDACHAIGTRYKAGNESVDIGACAHSDAAAFSFHPVKTIAMGEGGAVTTRDADLFRRMELDRSHGLSRDPSEYIQADAAFGDSGAAHSWYYEMAAPGLNYRASDIHCALGASQLQKLDQFVSARQALARDYDRLFGHRNIPLAPLGHTPDCDAAWHLYVVRIDFEGLGISRGSVMAKLKDAGVGTQVHYVPVHSQPYYAAKPEHAGLSGADAFYAQCLSLPLFATMSQDDVAYVVDALADSLGA